MDISTQIGKLKLASCVGNASGCWCTTPEELNELCKAADLGFVVSKSGTREVRDGNPCPRLHIDARGSINSMGIPNLGFRFYADYASAAETVTGTPVIQSIHPFSLDELRLMLIHVRSVSAKCGRILAVEVNLSCPNLVGFSNQSLFYDDRLLSPFLDVINEEVASRSAQQSTSGSAHDLVVVGLKLPAFYAAADFDRISTLLLKYENSIKFVTCFNSVANGLMVDAETESALIHPRGGLGGIGGSYCKPIGLANVLNFAQRCKGRIAVIGCGGIETGRDAFEYILCGADAVQVGTHLLRTGPICFSIIAGELRQLMSCKGYKSLADFRGKLRIPPASLPPPASARSTPTRSSSSSDTKDEKQSTNKQSTNVDRESTNVDRDDHECPVCHRKHTATFCEHKVQS